MFMPAANFSEAKPAAHCRNAHGVACGVSLAQIKSSQTILRVALAR
jgi:hypothetical protein